MSKKIFSPLLLPALLAGLLVSTTRPSPAASLPADVLSQLNAYNEVWPSASTNGPLGSMPLGNGEVTANVWVENGGDLMLYFGRSDTWSEGTRHLKLGRVRIHLVPNPFTNGAPFTQTLDFYHGKIDITAGQTGAQTRLRLWIDANQPVIRVEANGDQTFTMTSSNEVWRTAPNSVSDSSSFGMPAGWTETADAALSLADRVVVYHRNATSPYQTILTGENLSGQWTNYPDVYTNRTFGVTVKGTNFNVLNNYALQSASGTNFTLSIYSCTAQTSTLTGWQNQMSNVVAQVDAADYGTAWANHCNWWDAFWNRSWIFVSGDANATNTTRGYIETRFVSACQGRGNHPIKFNGGSFLFDFNGQNADYHPWGPAYWNQNTRLIYWPMVAAGDYDLLQPLFNAYTNMMPLQMTATSKYYGHGGAFFPETFNFFGLYTFTDWGTSNPNGTVAASQYMRYHWQGGLEVLAMMLDCYDRTQDAAFATNCLIPYATQVIRFFDQHWSRVGGQIVFSPAQALETYWGCTNPTDYIAGLRNDIPKLLALPAGITTPALVSEWTNCYAALPPLPLDGTGTYVKPAQTYGSPNNNENPECYCLFPYRILGIGKNLTLGLSTFNHRVFKTLPFSPGNFSWDQDVIQEPLLGLTSAAQAQVNADFVHIQSGCRFAGFGCQDNDGFPANETMGAAATGLQFMLMQCNGAKINLLPSWPTNWNVDFKLWAPSNTTVRVKVQGGSVTQTDVSPAIRTNNLVAPSPSGLTALAGDTQATLQWNAALTATTYNVKRATISGGSYTTIATGVSATTYTDTGLTDGVTYYYVVSAVGSLGESDNSAEASIIPAPTLYWDGGASTVNGASDNASTSAMNWLSGGNWDNGATSAPLASWPGGYSAAFGGSATSQTITLASTITIGNLIFGQGPQGAGTNGTSYTISGGTITLANNTISNNTDTVISSVLAGSSGSLTKSGPATLTLTAAQNNNYTGNTTVSAGKLLERISGNVAWTRSTANTTINSGATLTLDATALTSGGTTFNLNQIAVNSGGTLELYDTNAGGTLVTAGAISGSGAIIKTGAGTFDIAWNGGSSGAILDNFSGAIIVAAGTLAVNNSGGTVGSGNASLTVNSGTAVDTHGTTLKIDALNGAGGTLSASYAATVNLGNANGNGTFSGALQNGSATLSLIKNGSGTQILTGNNTYTGTTTVNGGALLINGPGSLANTAVTVQNTGTFGGNGTLAGPVAVQSGGTLTPGTASSIGALTLNNSLTLSAGCTNFLRLAKTGGVAINDAIKGVTSTLNYAGTLIVSNVTADASLLANGDTFKLFNAANYSGAFAALTLPPLGPGLKWATNNLAVNGSIAVTYSNTVTTPNFSPPGGTYAGPQPVTIVSDAGATIFYTMDGSTPGPTSAVYAGPVNIPANTVSLTLKAYATQSGFGDSAVASATYSTVPTQTWTNTAGGSWPVAANWSNGVVAGGRGVAADFSTLNLTADATVTLDGARTNGGLVFGDTTPDHNWILNTGTGGPLTLDASYKPAIIVNNQTAIIGAVLAGTNGLSKSGAGTLALTNASTFTGGVTINAGTLSLNNVGALNPTSSNSVTLNGNNATLQVVNYKPATGPITVAAGATGAGLIVDNTSATAQTGFNLYGIALNGPLTITYYRNNSQWLYIDNYQKITGTGGGSGNDSLVFVQSGSTGNPYYQVDGHFSNDFTGNVHVKSGAWAVQAFNSFVPGTDQFFPAGALLILDSGTTWTWNNASAAFAQSLDGLAGSGAMNKNAVNCTLTINAINPDNNANRVFSGTISGMTGPLTVSGTGPQVFAGSGINYTYATTINGGTLLLSNCPAFASAVTVNSNGAFGGTGTSSAAVTVNGGGTLAPGVGGIGTLTLSSTLTLNGRVLLKVSKGATPNADKIVVSGQPLTYAGTLTVTNIGTNALVAGDAFTLFSAASYNGVFAATNLPVLTSGMQWNWNATNGTLSIFNTVNITPTNLVFTITSSMLILNWPADHLGWHLQWQTNSLTTGLCTNWITVLGSDTITSTNITLDPLKVTVFYRLIYP
jgi:autotransporter-associated beta strand protein